jgi:hypothetical protein
MGLATVWLDTLSDGLVRADMVVGIDVHRTPEIGGKPSHWLVDAVLPTGIGGGGPDGWMLGPTHRTLVQTDDEPREAPAQLARLLAHLDAADAAGVISVSTQTRRTAGHGAAGSEWVADPGAPVVRFRFSAFSDSQPATG